MMLDELEASVRRTDRAAIILFAVMAAVLIAIVVIFAIQAFGPKSGPADDRFGLTDVQLTSRVICDGKTGVYYLVIDDTGVTPLINADGLPMMVDDLNHGDMEAALTAARVNLGVDDAG